MDLVLSRTDDLSASPSKMQQAGVHMDEVKQAAPCTEMQEVEGLQA